MRARRFGVGLFLWGIVTAASASAQSAIPWQASLEEAKQISAQTNRPLLVHFWTETCGPCMRMEREVFSRPEVADAIRANYIPVRINVLKYPNLARQYGVTAWPTEIILSPTGEVIERKIGAADAAQYLALLNQVATRTRASGMPPQVAQGASPPVYDTSPGFGQAAGRVPPSNVRPQVAYGQEAFPTPAFDPRERDAAIPPNASGGIPSGGRPPAQGASQPWQPEIAQWNRGGMPSANPGYNPGLGEGPRPQQTAPPKDQYHSPYGIGYQSHPPAGVSQASPSGTTAGGPPERPLLSAQPEIPPLGLEGYCPVTLLEQERWVRGDPRHGVIHRGRTYLFAGAEEAKRFFADPDRYAPVLSGIDVVVAVEENRQVPGKREYGAWYEGRMYLFSSEDSFRKFDRDPSRYAAAASQVAQASPRR